MDNMNNYIVQVTSRALIVKNRQLLLVSNDYKLWYTPGGHLKPSEILPDCVVRAVKEEIGIHIKPNQIVFVADFLDKKHNVHKVEVYFSAEIFIYELPKHWVDQDGLVKTAQFFDIETLQDIHVVPAFLKTCKWLDLDLNIYQGAENR